VPIIRSASLGDLGVGARLCFDAFRTIAEAHGRESEFASIDSAVFAIAPIIASGSAVVAEVNGEILGFGAILDLGGVGSIGPIATRVDAEGRGVGTAVVGALVQRAKDSGWESVRLMRATYQSRAARLYERFGFVARATFEALRGVPSGDPSRHATLARPAVAQDVPICVALSRLHLGFDRGSEIERSIEEGFALVVEGCDGPRSYSAGLGFLGHTVARDVTDFEMLVRAARSFGGLGYLCPTESGLADSLKARGVHSTAGYELMVRGSWIRPEPIYCPSIRG
jgi:GNAT superfamily N-acetyltransferase